MLISFQSRNAPGFRTRGLSDALALVEEKLQEMLILDQDERDSDPRIGYVAVSKVKLAHPSPKWYRRSLSFSGRARFDNGLASALTLSARSGETFHFRALRNGTKLYAAPVNGSHHVILERADGLIYTDSVADSAYLEACIESMRRLPA